MAVLLSLKDLTMLRGSADFDDESQPCQKIFRLVFASRLLPPDDYDTVRDWPGLPANGDPLKPGDPRVLKRKRVAGLNETGCEFLVTCDFEVPKNTWTYEPNPLARPDQLSGSGSKQSRPYFIDESAAGLPVINTAGWPYERQPEQTYSPLGVTIRGNRATLDLPLFASYLDPNAINAGDVLVRGVIFPAGTLKLVGINFSEQIENAIKFWQVEWLLELAVNWMHTMEDRGYFELDGGDSKEIYVPGTIPPARPTQPWPLDGTGMKKASSIAPPHTSDYQPQPDQDFSVFGWTPAA